MVDMEPWGILAFGFKSQPKVDGLNAPIVIRSYFIRIFSKEVEHELWKRSPSSFN
jgi:hypothetical protein